eukprot:5316434-Pyramimonas_sp.AAC.1
MALTHTGGSGTYSASCLRPVRARIQMGKFLHGLNMDHAPQKGIQDRQAQEVPQPRHRRAQQPTKARRSG